MQDRFHLNHRLFSFAAFEFLDNHCMDVVETHLKYRNPINKFPFYVLVETSGSNADHDEEVWRIKCRSSIIVVETGVEVKNYFAEYFCIMF